jgi:hypothetical protein
VDEGEPGEARETLGKEKEEIVEDAKSEARATSKDKRKEITEEEWNNLLRLLELLERENDHLKAKAEKLEVQIHGLNLTKSHG